MLNCNMYRGCSCLRQPSVNPPYGVLPAPREGEPFSLPPTKSCPRLRGKCRGVAVTKGERLKLPSNFTIPPQLRLRSAAPPQAVAPFGRCPNSFVKPPSPREVDFAKQKPEGVEKESRFARYRQPLSRLRRQLPGRGAFGYVANSNQKLSPFTGKVSRRSRDERGMAKAAEHCEMFPLSLFAIAHRQNAGWNMVVLLRCRLQYSLFRPILPSLHRPLGALGSNPPQAVAPFGAPYRASSILFKNSSSGAKSRLCSLPLRRKMSVCEAFALSVLSAPARVKGMPSG